MAQNPKSKINLAAAAEAEAFGALAVGHPHSFAGTDLATSVATLRSLLKLLKEAGAATHTIKVGKSSLRMSVKNKQQTLVLQD